MGTSGDVSAPPMKRVRRNCSEEVAEQAGYNEYKGYMLERGYAGSLIDEAIEQAEGVPRDRLLGITKDAPKSSHRKYPLIVKFNPKLPPMSKFIHKHLHILELTKETADMFNKNTIFVSYKMEQNILSMITRNKFKTVTAVTSGDSVEVAGDSNADWGCFGCEKSCTVCENFLVLSKTFTSPNTTQTFNIKSRIDCDTKGVIYLINDLKCPEIFYLGYTEDTIKVRFRNHKSHIKVGKKSCEIASHFIATANSIHKIDKSDQKIYTSQLKEHLSIQLIEHVEAGPGQNLTAKLLERESFWQGALKSTTLYGGINKRSNRK